MSAPEAGVGAAAAAGASVPPGILSLQRAQELHGGAGEAANGATNGDGEAALAALLDMLARPFIQLYSQFLRWKRAAHVKRE